MVECWKTTSHPDRCYNRFYLESYHRIFHLKKVIYKNLRIGPFPPILPFIESFQSKPLLPWGFLSPAPPPPDTGFKTEGKVKVLLHWGFWTPTKIKSWTVGSFLCVQEPFGPFIVGGTLCELADGQSDRGRRRPGGCCFELAEGWLGLWNPVVSRNKKCLSCRAIVCLIWKEQEAPGTAYQWLSQLGS